MANPAVRRGINFFGLFLILMGAFMTLPLITALIYDEDASFRAFSLVILMCFITGLIIRVFFKADLNSMILRPRDSYFIVTTSWLLASLVGCLPYMLTGSIPNFFEAFFETCSGFTTTGSTILSDIEALPRSVLMWRSFTQWLGGMGIIVLFVALMPDFGIKALNIAKAETPGPTVTKVSTRFTGTAQRMYVVYIALTAVLAMFLLSGGMSIYEAINHAFTTMATGGFSVYNDSIAHFHSNYISWVITLFMVIAGTNFELFFIAMHGQVKKALANEEFRVYIAIVTAATLSITAVLLLRGEYSNAWQALTDSAFQVSTVISTTGYATVNYDLWPSFCKMVIFLLMITGASSSSTAGGLKIVRVVVLFKMIKREIRIKLHETIVNDVCLDGRKLIPETVVFIIGFITTYIITLLIATVLISLTGEGNMISNLTAVLTCISNVGPGFDATGPVCNFAFYSSFSKLVLSVVMIAGRLELSTFFILFSRFFWNPDRV